MDKQKLNNLVVTFKVSNNDTDFIKLYESLEELRKRTIRGAITKGVTPDDAQEVFDDTLIRCVEKFEPSIQDFENYLNFSLKNKMIDKMRKEKVKRSHEVFIGGRENTDKENTYLEEILFNQGSYITNEHHEEHYQRQLVNEILNKVKDPLTTAIVKEVLNDGSTGKLSPTAIGRKLGVHHMTVTRSLGKLKKYYDSAVFGDYRDYLCG